MKRILRWMVVFALVTPQTGCVYGYAFDPEDAIDVRITDSSYDDAFSKVLFALSELDYTVNGDRNAGTFHAFVAKGAGFGTTTTINGLLTALSDDDIRLKLRIKSSRGSTEVADEFMTEYGKYVNASVLD